VVPLGDAQRGVLAPISDAASRERLKALLQPRTPVGATNMEGALKLATRLLLDSAGGNRPVIVFLTDGKPEPPEQRPGLEAAIAEAGRRNLLVFPILLGGETDVTVADRMVRETGSMRQDVQSAAGLLRAFGQVYALVQPERYVDELSLTPGGSLTYQTNPDQAISEAVVIVPRGSAGTSALPVARQWRPSG